MCVTFVVSAFCVGYPPKSAIIYFKQYILNNGVLYAYFYEIYCHLFYVHTYSNFCFNIYNFILNIKLYLFSFLCRSYKIVWAQSTIILNFKIYLKDCMSGK